MALLVGSFETGVDTSEERARVDLEPSRPSNPKRRCWAAVFLARDQPMKAEANISETMVITLITMFIAGPEVSLKGSPTVSPITAAV